MNRRARTTARICVALAAAIVLAACGSSSNNASPATQRPGTTAPGAKGDARTPAQLAADKKLAQQASFMLRDFPDGWQAKPDDNSTNADDQRNTEAFGRCLNIDPAFIKSGDSHDAYTTPDFNSPDGNQTASSNIGLTPNAAHTTQIVQAFAQPSAPQCLATFFNAELTLSVAKNPGDLNGAKIGKATVGQVQFPQLDDRTVALRVDVPISAKGLSLDVYVDLVIIQRDRAGALLLFEDVGSPFPISDAEKYAKTVAQRLAALPLDGSQT